MRLLVVVVDRDRVGDITSLLDGEGVTGYSLLLAVLGQALALVGPEQATSLTAGLREIKRSFLSGQGLMALALDAVSLA